MTLHSHLANAEAFCDAAFRSTSRNGFHNLRELLMSADAAAAWH